VISPLPRRSICGRVVLLPVTLAVTLALLAGACDRAAPDENRPPADPAEPTANGPVAADIGALLDPASRDLLTTIDPVEAIVATLTTPDVEAVAAAARSRGLTAEVVANDILVVDGPLEPVLAFAADVHPVSLGLGEDPRVDRWLPAERPVVAIPVPGRPYLTQPMLADLSRLTMPPDRRVPMLRSFANAIETIDGQPYARLDLSGSCDPEELGIVCTLYSSAWVAGAGERDDERSMRGDAQTGWRGTLVDGTVMLQSVPRPLVRAAEWTARHDPTATKALEAYDTCCGARWDPTEPGQIELTYVRPCAESVAPPDQKIASTGDCFERLLITVDIGVGTVLSIDALPGP
jgi:hypothetical protein